MKGNCDGYVADLNDRAQDTQFARDRMTATDLVFLESLPITEHLEVAVGRSVLICHANPQNLEDPLGPDMDEANIRPLLSGVDAEIVAFGHVHVPYVRQLPPWTLVDVASVGLPRDGDRRSVYAVMTWDRGQWSIEHHRVEYDWDAVARDFATVGFPDADTAAATLLGARYQW